MQALLPHYLEASMENFRANQMKLHKAFEESLGSNPLAKLAQQNMAMFKAAAAAFMPGAEKGEAAAAAPEPAAEAPRDDLDALKAQMAEMQKKLDALIK
jgi:polyhydroxyalkanoate synthesis regulator protein